MALYALIHALSRKWKYQVVVLCAGSTVFLMHTIAVILLWTLAVAFSVFQRRKCWHNTHPLPLSLKKNAIKKPWSNYQLLLFPFTHVDDDDCICEAFFFIFRCCHCSSEGPIDCHHGDTVHCLVRQFQRRHTGDSPNMSLCSLAVSRISVRSVQVDDRKLSVAAVSEVGYVQIRG